MKRAWFLTDRPWEKFHFRAQTFHLLDERARLEAWFSDFFGFPLTMKRDAATGFPDDLDSPGPTLLSLETLAEIGSWFSE
jgi:uncharacterized protein YcbX